METKRGISTLKADGTNFLVVLSLDYFTFHRVEVRQAGTPLLLRDVVSTSGKARRKVIVSGKKRSWRLEDFRREEKVFSDRLED